MDIYYLDTNHRWTCIIWTYTANRHILLGHKPLLDLYHLDIYHRWTYIIWTYLIMMNMNHKPQQNMDYWTHPTVGHLTPN